VTHWWCLDCKEDCKEDDFDLCGTCMRQRMAKVKMEQEDVERQSHQTGGKDESISEPLLSVKEEDIEEQTQEAAEAVNEEGVEEQSQEAAEIVKEDIEGQTHEAADHDAADGGNMSLSVNEAGHEELEMRPLL